MQRVCDFLVVGSGLAGLTFATHLPEQMDILLLAKRSREDGATDLAQGGVAAVIDAADSFEDHVRDTLDAGAGLCREDVVRSIVEDGPKAIAMLRAAGADFNRSRGNTLALGLEGGHGARRIVHAADQTGHEVQRAMLQRCEAHPGIRCIERYMVIDLIRGDGGEAGPDRVQGAYVLDVESGEVHTIFARKAVVLATGGSGKAYLYTSNPDTATGDGVAMAFRAGAPIANMEFMQFHPTCFYHPKAKTLLISEALRGEGGVLKSQDGRAFMDAYDPRASLAPRDIVARAIDSELKRTGAEFALLDMTHLNGDFLLQRFPTIHHSISAFGVDMRSQPIPVVPAAHYQCGGVMVDAEGRSSLAGLFALGECACTGLHGANRLASNSLLEAVVVSMRAAKLAAELPSWEPGHIRAWDPGRAVPADEHVVVTQNWDELRRSMWNYVGIVRTDRRLRRALRRLDLLEEEIREYYWRVQVDRDFLELRNLATVARLTVSSALSRRESRGLHFNSDCLGYDEPGFAQHDTVLRSGDDGHVVFEPYIGRHDRRVDWPAWRVATGS